MELNVAWTNIRNVCSQVRATYDEHLALRESLTEVEKALMEREKLLKQFRDGLTLDLQHTETPPDLA